MYAVDNLKNPTSKIPLTLGKVIASGGAGEIRICEQDRNLVIKLYKNKAELKNYQEKIEAMSAAAPFLGDLKRGKDEIPQISWPSDFVVSQTGGFLGYRMPKMNLDEFISLERVLQKRMRRHENFPEFVGHRINIAYYLCAALAALHERGHYVVDLKPQNCFVHRSSMVVTLLDSDGFSILGKNGERFPAYQFSEEYIAPEGIKKSPTELGENQDLFALAVIIFKLLNNGVHPFQAGMSRARKTIQEMVAGKKYAYGESGPGSLIPNAQSVHNYFPSELRQMFDRAFTQQKNRPSADEWKNTLSSLGSGGSINVVRCDVSPEEHLDFGLGCGFCAIQQQNLMPKKRTSKLSRNASPAKTKSGVRRVKRKRAIFKKTPVKHTAFVKTVLVSREDVAIHPSFKLDKIEEMIKGDFPNVKPLLIPLILLGIAFVFILGSPVIEGLTASFWITVVYFLWPVATFARNDKKTEKSVVEFLFTKAEVTEFSKVEKILASSRRRLVDLKSYHRDLEKIALGVPKNKEGVFDRRFRHSQVLNSDLPSLPLKIKNKENEVETYFNKLGMLRNLYKDRRDSWISTKSGALAHRHSVIIALPALLSFWFDGLGVYIVLSMSLVCYMGLKSPVSDLITKIVVSHEAHYNIKNLLP